MTNIAILINTLLSAGAEKQSVILAKMLSEKFNVSLIVFYGDQIEDRFLNALEDTDVDLIVLKGGVIKKTRHLISIFRKKRVEVLFSSLLTSNFFGAIAGKVAGVRFLVGGIRNSVLVPWKFVLEKGLHLFLHDHTIFNNYSGQRALLKRGFLKRKTSVIHNCFESLPSPINRIENTPIKILSVGRFVAQKDYETAIKTIDHLRANYDSFKNMTYQIVGYGELEADIKESIKRRGLEESISIIIKPELIEDYYKQADVFFITSNFEGLSNAIMEAMSFSLPIVGTNVGDNNQLVKAKVNGYLSGIGNYRLLAEKLHELLSSHERRILFGNRSYNFLKKHYSLNVFRNRYTKFIEQLT